jgi:hypothetical protein
MLTSMQEGWGGKWLRGLTTILDLSVLAGLSSLWNLWYYIRDGKRWSERACGSVWARHNMHGKPVIHVISNVERARGIELLGPSTAAFDCPVVLPRRPIIMLASMPEGSVNSIDLGVRTYCWQRSDWVGRQKIRVIHSGRPPTNVCERDRPLELKGRYNYHT